MSGSLRRFLWDLGLYHEEGPEDFEWQTADVDRLVSGFDGTRGSVCDALIDTGAIDVRYDAGRSIPVDDRADHVVDAVYEFMTVEPEAVR